MSFEPGVMFCETLMNNQITACMGKDAAIEDCVLFMGRLIMSCTDHVLLTLHRLFTIMEMCSIN